VGERYRRKLMKWNRSTASVIKGGSSTHTVAFETMIP